jgi:cytochrome c-type biogenesis protein CcmH/NrfG
MAYEAIPNTVANPSLKASPVFAFAAVCLVAGLAIGYLARTAHLTEPVAQSPARSSRISAAANAAHAGRMPSLDDMRHMADTQAAPSIEKLKNDPNNSALLAQVGAIYHSTHQFREAAAYYGKAVQFDPKNVGLRTKFATSLYRDGDADGAIAQLNAALKENPKDANSLFNLGMIRLQGKHDPNGAIAAWQKLLKANPALNPDRKAQVQKLMADVLTMMGDQHGLREVQVHDEH